jgi:glycosyltransferase involved in cell wall biosynthesis
MVKVCHMTSAHQSNDVRIFQKECTSLANAGFDVYLVAQGESYDRNGVHVVGIGEPSKSRIGRMIKSARAAYKQAVEINAQIYHFHDPELLPYAVKLSKRGKHVIFDSHENYALQIIEKKYIPRILRKTVSRLYKFYETYAVKQFDAAIIPCTFGGVNIFDNIAKKTVYLDNMPLLSELFDKYQEKNLFGCQSICHVGGLTYERGITHLIKAADKAGVGLILAGKFMPPNYFDEVKEMQQFGCVDYKGYLDRNEVMKVYRESVIGVCTILNVGQYNLGDNFATKVYEYMSSGLPVIISDCPYARKAIKEFEFGICVQPDDVDAIADAISYLLDNPEVARELGENGRRAVLEKYNWDFEERKLLTLYEELSGIKLVKQYSYCESCENIELKGADVTG